MDYSKFTSTFLPTPEASPTKPLQLSSCAQPATRPRGVPIPAQLPPIPNQVILPIKQEVPSFLLLPSHSSFLLGFSLLGFVLFCPIFNFQKKKIFFFLFQKNPEPLSKKRKLVCAEPAPLPVPIKPTLIPSGSTSMVVGASSQELPEHMKRQQRLMKNREAALTSRQRRKDYMKQLETHVTSLQKENEDLKKKIQALESKNTDLTNHLNLGTKPALKAGVMIMVVFFSFAVILTPLSLRKADPADISRQSTSFRTLQSLSTPELDTASSLSSSPFPPGVQTSESVKTQEQTVSALAQLKPDSLLEGQVFYNETDPNYELLPFTSGLEDSHTMVETTDLRYWLDQSLGSPVRENSLTVSERYNLSFSYFPQVLLIPSPYFPSKSLGAKPDVAYVFCSEVLQILPNVKSVSFHNFTDTQKHFS